MSRSILSLATPGVQQLHPYQPGKPVEELERELGISQSIKLASNENPLGPSLLAVRAIEQAAADVHYYPDGSGFQLSRKLAQHFSIDAECVTLGNGSNDILELVTRAFLGPQYSAVYSEYSFAVYPIVVQAVGARANVAKAFDAGHPEMPLGHDPQAMLQAIDDDTRIVFIANPNNPTGTWLQPDVLHELVSAIAQDTVVVLDMAYQEYMDEALRIDIAGWLQQFPNLLIAGTFSKIHALAGLRIGYGLSSPEMADVLNRVRQPFNTNSLAQAAALAALDDEQHVRDSVVMNNAGKAYLQQAFDDMGLRHLPSMGNFISVQVNTDGAALYQKLLQQGVIVRPVANYNMPDYLRITIGTQEQNQRFVSALQAVL